MNCKLCEAGFPLVNGNHLPTQGLGMIPVTRCTNAEEQLKEIVGRMGAEHFREALLKLLRDSAPCCPSTAYQTLHTQSIQDRLRDSKHPRGPLSAVWFERGRCRALYDVAGALGRLGHRELANFFSEEASKLEGL